MKKKLVDYYMDIAHRTAILSNAEKLKVGAILIKDNNIIGFSYNGTPHGCDNNCENKVYMDGDAGPWFDAQNIETKWPFQDIKGRYYLKTKPEVSHAEENLILKLARSNESTEGGIMFITHNPCYTCSRMIYGARISEVYYSDDYRDSSGIDFLLKCGIKVEKYERK